MSEVIYLFLQALLGSVIALFGGIVFLFSKNLSRTLEKYSIPFAAGVLITVSMLGLLPEAVDYFGEDAFVVALIAFLAAFLFDHVILHLHHHNNGKAKSIESSVPLVILGDTIHNFIDGVAIAAGFMVAPGLGLITALSTLLHEVPHEISDFGILLRAKWPKKNILMVNIISSSVTIVGAFFVYFFAGEIGIIGKLLAVSAGLFLYLGASDFLPQISEDKKNIKRNIIPLIAGVVIMLVTLLAVPHSHENEVVDPHIDEANVHHEEH